MDREFEGKAVIVTGASRGIGAATAIAFAREGAHVIINYREKWEAANQVLAQIQSENNQATVIQADLTQPEQLLEMVERVENHIEPIGVLVNNAAMFNRQSFLDVRLEEFDRVWSTNVRGVYYLSQLVARHMARRRNGAIINVSSILSHQTIKRRTAYAATKGAIDALTHSMALDLIPFNIRVNAVVPGPFRTDGLLDGMPSDVQEGIQKSIPCGRLGEPMEAAQTILFLASESSRYIVGALIPVDGGLSMREAVPPGQ